MNKNDKSKSNIMSYIDFKAYTLAIARGDIKPEPNDPKEWFDSEETRREIAIERLRKFRGTLPADFRFDRDEANGRGRKNFLETLIQKIHQFCKKQRLNAMSIKEMIEHGRKR